MESYAKLVPITHVCAQILLPFLGDPGRADKPARADATVIQGSQDCGTLGTVCTEDPGECLILYRHETPFVT